MSIRAGSICLVKYPFTDQAVAKLRPVLVAEVQNPTFLAITDGADSPAGNHLNLLQITSQNTPGLYNIVVDPSKPEFAGTGLVKTSTIMCWNINTIHKVHIERTLGEAPELLMQEVRERLKDLLSL